MPRKLKVFRTSIGFHDAYVAAPSQKAALEAWRADSNLFTQGLAEQVTDPELMEEPLERPGEVVKRLRGTEAEQIAALGESAPGGARKKGRSRINSATTNKEERPPKPSRGELDGAEAALKDLEETQRAELREVEHELQALERRRRELHRRHARERDEAATELDRKRSNYERELRRWKKHN